MEALTAVSDAFTEAMRRSRQSAIDLGDPVVGVGHLALGVLRCSDGNGRAAIERIVPTLHELEAVLLDVSRTTAADADVSEEELARLDPSNVMLASTAEHAVESARIEVGRLGASVLDTGELLLGILRDRHTPVADAFARFGVTYESIEREISASAPPIGG